MLSTRRRGRELHLFTPSDLTDPEMWPALERLASPYLLTLWWTENFLTRPHPDLGRAGPTCPFVRPSLDKQLFWITAIPGRDILPVDVEETMLGYRDWFMELDPVEGDDTLFKSIVVLLPDVQPDDYARIIDATQRKLKPEFVNRQLMIGQFHPGCDEPGVRNKQFRPLKSPMPLLVIRSLAAGDVVFMKSADGQYDRDYLKSYLRAFAEGLPTPFIDELAENLTAATSPDRGRTAKLFPG